MKKKNKTRSVTGLLFGFMERVSGDHVGAYATQAAYFLIMSFIPCILFLTTLVRYTPLTYNVVRDAIVAFIPENLQSFVLGIVAVGHIGDREVNDSVSAKERKRTDWAIILHTIYINISPGRAYDSKCLIHIILPPLRVSLQAQCAHCLRHRQLHLYRCGHRQLQVHAEQRHLLLQQHPASVHCR